MEPVGNAEGMLNLWLSSFYPAMESEVSVESSSNDKPIQQDLVPRYSVSIFYYQLKSAKRLRTPAEVDYEAQCCTYRGQKW